MSKYKILRVPKDAYYGLLDKQTKIAGRIHNLTKKQVRFPLTNLFKTIADNPLEVSDRYLLDNFTKKRGRKKSQ